jgi:hypothetical protein
MRMGIAITSLLLLLALAVPAGVAAAPAKLSRADAQASARIAAELEAQGLDSFGYHTFSVRLEETERLGPRRFRSTFGLTFSAIRPEGKDGICLVAVYTRKQRSRPPKSQVGSLSCTALF